MTRREIVFLFCRLLGVYLFMTSLSGLGDTISSLGFLEQSWISIGSKTTININNRPAQLTDLIGIVLFRLLPMLVQWAAAIGAWMFAGEIAKRVFDGVPDEVEVGPKLELGRDARSLAFACLGAFFLLQDSSYLLGGLFSKLSNLITGYAANSYYSPFGWTMWARVLISLYLIFGNGGLAWLWNALQNLDPRNRANKM